MDRIYYSVTPGSEADAAVKLLKAQQNRFRRGVTAFRKRFSIPSFLANYSDSETLTGFGCDYPYDRLRAFVAANALTWKVKADRTVVIPNFKTAEGRAARKAMLEIPSGVSARDLDKALTGVDGAFIVHKGMGLCIMHCSVHFHSPEDIVSIPIGMSKDKKRKIVTGLREMSQSAVVKALGKDLDD